MKELEIKSMYSLEHTMAAPMLSELTYPWEALSRIKKWIVELGEALDKEEYEEVFSQVWIHRTAKVFDSAYIAGPTIIGPDTEVRQCAFIRGNALVGANCVVGNSTELKNVIIFDNVQVPHYNYVGDSILGYKSHMGAGSITSNVKSDKTLVRVKSPEHNLDIDTGLKKFGAMLGDNVEVGC
ncbi:MAG: UDP-N-acetylglucosamine pyrophosphorylase, partial [Lachnospiraceae bacterium]|nr:UDP-N-acetylglucosamine pyrophosphorylase [Lachnospiraceae bacterium]